MRSRNDSCIFAVCVEVDVAIEEDAALELRSRRKDDAIARSCDGAAAGIDVTRSARKRLGKGLRLALSFRG